MGSVAAGVVWSKRRENSRRDSGSRAAVVADDLAEGVTRTAATAAATVADVAEGCPNRLRRWPM